VDVIAVTQGVSHRKAGNHAFRRFRNTYLRNYTECPEGLYEYWMGHAGCDMSDLYDKVKEDVGFRSRKWAERVRVRVRVVLSCTECTENRPKIGIDKSSVND
jgi:integrase